MRALESLFEGERQRRLVDGHPERGADGANVRLDVREPPGLPGDRRALPLLLEPIGVGAEGHPHGAVPFEEVRLGELRHERPEQIEDHGFERHAGCHSCSRSPNTTWST